MFYPKARCCPFNSDDEKMPLTKNDMSVRAEDENTNNDHCGCDNNNSDMQTGSRCEMMRKIQEIDFALIDLNLFLDTHPNCKEALELFTKLAATSKSLKSDYQRRFGPLYAVKSPNTTPFMWVDEDYKWPWQKQEGR